MKTITPPASALLLSTLLSTLLSACGGGGSGAEVEARSQTLTVDAAPSSTLTTSSTTTLRASASSGLAVTFRSATPEVCQVDARSGVVSSLRAGTCRIQLDQSGNETYAPAATLTVTIEIQADAHQTLRFATAPTLTLGGTATVQAAASSGLPVRYSSLTPEVCQVDAASGLVSSLTAGDCRIAADQDGSPTVLAAQQVTQTLAVQVPASLAAPDTPQGVRVTAGVTPDSVIVSAQRVDSGGSAILRYRVRAVPAGIELDSPTLPVTVNCPGGCAGLAFTLSAHNAVGEGSASAPTHIRTRYNVVSTFYEPDTQPRNTVFTGSFWLDATTGEVSALQGTLTESMTGTATGASPYFDMTQLTLRHQLSVIRDEALGGLRVSVFLNDNTLTFRNSAPGTSDFWTPQVGVEEGGIFYGAPTRQTGIPNPGNAYVMVFVDPRHPTAALTQAQLDKIAYADCAPGGMMGFACMTGTSPAGYGAVGTMSGYPLSQVITRATD
jgi:hypothetical protein